MRALALAAALLLATPALAQDITGPTRVIDGDTIDVVDQRIRQVYTPFIAIWNHAGTNRQNMA